VANPDTTLAALRQRRRRARQKAGEACLILTVDEAAFGGPVTAKPCVLAI
jgi:hypothetical protein